MPIIHPPLDDPGQRIPTEPAHVNDEQLARAEAMIAACILRRDVADLRVLGFGEISVALGWPSADPTMVLKRMAVYREPSDAERDVRLVRDYVAALEAAGVDVLPTTCHVVPRADGRWVNYAVQPIVPPDLLAETTIARDTPHPEHPLLLAIRDLTVELVSPQLSADMQVTNFAWDGERLALLDITTPLLFDEQGGLPQVSPEVMAAVPLPARRAVLKEAFKIIERYQDRSETLALVVLLLYRIGQERWVPAAAECFNEVLGAPLDLPAIEAEFVRYNKTIPTLNRAAMVQRWWTQRIRRNSYDFFITDSFTGRVL
ncbi:MAG: hypothetical protein HKN26_15115 [Acidimicrobiales bacterium]|nr:hypothetical protein [Acidimicrobiales bacterium]